MLSIFIIFALKQSRVDKSFSKPIVFYSVLLRNSKYIYIFAT